MVLLLAAVTPAPASAQGFLEQFSYEGLGLSGIGVEMGGAWSDRVAGAVSGGVRIDYGMFAPRVRLLFGVNYFRGDLADDEIERFERRLEAVVIDPSGTARIDIGQITWTNVAADLDLQYLMPTASRVLGYAGVGLGVHLRNGTGSAIDDTFVEDALDTVAAAINLSLGSEIALHSRVHLIADVRGVLSSELRTVTVRGGLMYRIQTVSAP